MTNLKSLALISTFLAASTVSAADLSGKITARRQPVISAVVTADLLGAKGAAAVTVTRSGKDGTYILKNLRPGDYIMLVDSGGRRIYQGKFTLANASLIKNIDLQ